MANTAEIISLDDHRRSNRTEGDREWIGPSGALIRPVGRHVASGDSTDVAISEGGESPTLDALYGDATGELSNALRLLAGIESHVLEAHRLHKAGDVVGADNEISLMQAKLPELMCFTFSDGLGAVVVAVFHGLRNLHSEPASLDQVFAIKRAVEKIRREPFLGMDLALDLIDGLVGADLRTDPEEAFEVSEILADYSFS